LIEPVLEPRRAQHAERRALVAAKALARERVAELEPRVDELGDDELVELEQAGRLAHGEYTTAAYALRDKIRTRRAVLTAAAAAESEGVGEEPDVDVDADVGEVLKPTGDAE
jgi:hypothetical protein